MYVYVYVFVYVCQQQTNIVMKSGRRHPRKKRKERNVSRKVESSCYIVPSILKQVASSEQVPCESISGYVTVSHLQYWHVKPRVNVQVVETLVSVGPWTIWEIQI